MNHTYFRVTCQKNGDYYPRHKDYPSELQCIVLLSEKGKDYEAGGLAFIGTDNLNQLDIESKARVGDLIIINGYIKEHLVNPITCKSNAIGRLTLFMPSTPEYMFPPYYYFKDSKYKIYFATPRKKLERIKYYIVHCLRLLMNKSTPIDKGH